MPEVVLATICAANASVGSLPHTALQVSVAVASLWSPTTEMSKSCLTFSTRYIVDEGSVASVFTTAIFVKALR
jgi:hypothetical protein